jgi:hypothetical protein
MNTHYFKGSKEILTNAVLNKGTAFSQRERAMLGLRGLLPYTEEPLEVQKGTDLHAYS